MKGIYIAILVGFISFSALAQKLDPKESPATISISSNDEKKEPYFVIIADNKQFTLAKSYHKSEYDKPLNIIDPAWIERVHVYKGDKAIKKYGSLGENGVIVIELKRGELKNIPPEILNNFAAIKN